MSIYQSPFQHVLKGLADAPADAFALDADEMWMHWALEEARKGVGHTAPNPPVGCIVVQGDRLVAKGYHRSAGRPHAEAEALSSTTENLEGGTAYVTLEPCNHHGRTPPCTERLIQAKVKRVVVGTIDPNPQVNGAGMERLRQAGIDVKVMSGPFGERASELIAPFRRKVLNARPWVTLKSAVSFDGGIAAGKSQQTRITNAQSHAVVHRLRSCVDAVIVGESTAKVDDPALTVRETMGWGYQVSQPLAIVLSTDLDLSPQMAVFKSGFDRVILVHGPDASEDRVTFFTDRGVRCCEVRLEESSRHLDLEDVLTQLPAFDIQSVLVEPGSRLFGAFVRKALWDELFWFSAPVLLGSKSVALNADLGHNPHKWLNKAEKGSRSAWYRLDTDALAVFGGKT